MRDGRASGTAFIVFRTAHAVQKAVELNEATFGRCVSLSPSLSVYLSVWARLLTCLPPPHHGALSVCLRLLTQPLSPPLSTPRRRLGPLGARAQVRARRHQPPGQQPAGASRLLSTCLSHGCMHGPHTTFPPINPQHSSNAAAPARSRRAARRSSSATSRGASTRTPSARRLRRAGRYVRVFLFVLGMDGLGHA